MAANYQLIPFPVPDYLAQFLSFRLRAFNSKTPDGYFIDVDRYSFFGKRIINNLVAADAPPSSVDDALVFLKVSNFAGNNYPQVPDGERSFLQINPKELKKILEALNEDFNQSLICFVDGAEFAHLFNGWSPDQKRLGIRKTAIFRFCRLNGVDLEEKNYDALFKMYSRHKLSLENFTNKRLGKVTQGMSY